MKTSNVFLDIETIPEQPEQEAKALIAQTIKEPAQMSKPETIAEWHSGAGKYAGVKEKAIDDEYRKTSFDAAKGQICSIAWAKGDGEIKGICSDNDAELLTAFFDDVAKDIIAPYFIGHYVGGFDLKFLWRRAVILGIKPPFNLPFKGRHGSDYFCTMTEWCGFKDTISMDNLAKALRIESKKDMDGSMVWDNWKAGNKEGVLAYNKEDVRIVLDIYNRLKFKG